MDYMDMQLLEKQQDSSNSSGYWSMVLRSAERAGHFLGRVICCYAEAENPNDEIDCRIRENALKVLGLSEAEAQNRTVLDQRYQELRKEWGDRITKSANSEVLQTRFKTLLSRVEQSYGTLTRDR